MNHCSMAFSLLCTRPGTPDHVVKTWKDTTEITAWDQGQVGSHCTTFFISTHFLFTYGSDSNFNQDFCSLSFHIYTASHAAFGVFPVVWLLPVTKLRNCQSNSLQGANKTKPLNKSWIFVEKEINMHRNEEGHKKTPATTKKTIRPHLPPIPICPIRMSGGSLWKRETHFKQWRKRSFS